MTDSVDLQELAHHVLEVANRNQRSIESLVKRLEAYEKQLKDLVAQVPANLRAQFELRMKDISTATADAITSNLDDANAKANHTVNQLERIALFGPIRAVLKTALVCTVLVGIVVGTGHIWVWNFLPTYAEIMDRRVQIAELEEQERLLNDAIARHKLQPCRTRQGQRTCVRIDASTPQEFIQQGWALVP